jgi:lipopolysaccharide/colanic/teichoic acid biosynthesis glycosyltransferase
MATSAELKAAPCVCVRCEDVRVPASKRVLDVAVAFALILLLAPLMLCVAALVKLGGPGRVLLPQTRIGRGGQPFAMLKFRTMREGADDRLHREMNIAELRGASASASAEGIFKLEDDPRITVVGNWLRRSSIDELPQLFNVLRGEMSLVGPRPSLPWEVELYTPEQNARHAVLPGMTGLWQVSGRNLLPMPAMLALDVQYARSRSFALDLWILLRTPAALLQGATR